MKVFNNLFLNFLYWLIGIFSFGIIIALGVDTVITRYQTGYLYRLSWILIIPTLFYFFYILFLIFRSSWLRVVAGLFSVLCAINFFTYVLNGILINPGRLILSALFLFPTISIIYLSKLNFEVINKKISSGKVTKQFKPSFWNISLFVLIFIFPVLVDYFVLYKAHNTFENFYKYLGCKQVFYRQVDSAFCNTNSGKTLKIVKYHNQWFVDGKLPWVCLGNFCLGL